LLPWCKAAFTAIMLNNRVAGNETSTEHRIIEHYS
jgi:hypothetical protein